MSKFLGVLSVLVVIVVAMFFAAANAGYRTTIDLGLFTLYQVPVTLVAFSGLFVGMVLMFITGVYTDLKVRRILRDRFAEESRQERTAIDRNQQDLFGADPAVEDKPGEETLHQVESPGEAIEDQEPASPVTLEAEKQSDQPQLE